MIADHIQLKLKRLSTAEGLKARRLFISSLVAFPPEEQQATADYLDVACLRGDALAGATENDITSLAEYHHALFVSALTGKIDLQGLA